LKPKRERKKLRFALRLLILIDFCFVCIFNSNNYDDVQAEWERITLSYEILSDKKSRKQYDRHEFVAYPGAAVARAAMGVVSNGVESIGKSVFSMGASVLEQIINDQSDDK